MDGAHHIGNAWPGRAGLFIRQLPRGLNRFLWRVPETVLVGRPPSEFFGLKSHLRAGQPVPFARGVDGSSDPDALSRTAREGNQRHVSSFPPEDVPGSHAYRGHHDASLAGDCGREEGGAGQGRHGART